MSVAHADTFSFGAAANRSPMRWTWGSCAGIVALLAYGPLLWMFFRQQAQQPQYQFFPFVLAAFAWLVWQRYAQGAPCPTSSARGRWIDACLLLTAFAMLLLAIAIRSPWGGMTSFILLAAYGCRLLARSRTICNLWGVWLLLWLVIPVPFGFDRWAVAKLQRVSSRVSSFVLDALGVNHLMEGNTLALPGKQLFVDEACSGIVSILSVVACAVIFAVVKNRSPLHMLLLALIGIAWATAINVARISTIAFVCDRWGIDWSSGAVHEALSLALFLVTFAALLSSDQVLEVCLAPIATAWHEVHSTDLKFGARAIAIWDGITSFGTPRPVTAADAGNERPPFAVAAPGKLGLWAPVVLFAPLAVIQSGLFAYGIKVAPRNNPAVKRAMAIMSDALPQTLVGATQQSFESLQRDASSMHGMYSRQFRYTDDQGTEYVMSLDFSFFGGWHELSECYVAIGWSPAERFVRSAPPDALHPDWQYVEAEFEKPGGARGLVCFAEFNQYGDLLRPGTDWKRPAASFFATRNHYLEDGKTFQVQVWVASQGAIGDEQRARANAMLLAGRDIFINRVVGPAAALPSPAPPPTKP